MGDCAAMRAHNFVVRGELCEELVGSACGGPNGLTENNGFFWWAIEDSNFGPRHYQ